MQNLRWGALAAQLLRWEVGTAILTRQYGYFGLVRSRGNWQMTIHLEYVSQTHYRIGQARIGNWRILHTTCEVCRIENEQIAPKYVYRILRHMRRLRRADSTDGEKNTRVPYLGRCYAGNHSPRSGLLLRREFIVIPMWDSSRCSPSRDTCYTLKRYYA